MGIGVMADTGANVYFGLYFATEDSKAVAAHHPGSVQRGGEDDLRRQHRHPDRQRAHRRQQVCCLGGLTQVLTQTQTHTHPKQGKLWGPVGSLAQGEVSLWNVARVKKVEMWIIVIYMQF